MSRWTDHHTSHINGPTDGDFVCLDSFNQPQVFLRFIHADVHVHTSLEKEMAAHSSMLAWEIPRTEEPSRLRSMRSQESQT